MKEIICINDTFPHDYVMFYRQYGVQTPIKDQIYTIRDVVKPSLGGEYGLLLEEITNPAVPIKHHIFGTTLAEPSWSVKRFTNLDGSLLSKEEIKQILKQQSKTLVK